jgi:hypothetical protein
MRRMMKFAALMSAVVALTGISSPAQATAGRHCVLHLSDGGTVTCYSTFTEAIADSTDGRITDAPADAADAVTDARLKARLAALAEAKKTPGQVTKTGKVTQSGQQPTAADAAAAITLSAECKDINFGGGFCMVAEGNHICTTPVTDVDYFVENLAEQATEFNDAISSYITDVFATNCLVRHFEHANFGGLSTPFRQTQSNIGPDMNDRTTALIWS